jgi:hypothetical protein
MKVMGYKSKTFEAKEKRLLLAIRSISQKQKKDHGASWMK